MMRSTSLSPGVEARVTSSAAPTWVRAMMMVAPAALAAATQPGRAVRGLANATLGPGGGGGVEA